MLLSTEKPVRVYRRATVVDGRTPHALLLEMFTTEGTGTMVVPARTTTGEEPA